MTPSINDYRNNTHTDTQAYTEVMQISLAPITVHDIDARYLGWPKDSAVTQHIEARFATHTMESLRRYVRDILKNPDYGFYGIDVSTRGGERRVGNIKIGPIDRIHQTADVGLLIGEKRFGARHCVRGYQTAD